MTIVLTKVGAQALSFVVGAILTALAAWIKGLYKRRAEHEKTEAMTAAGIKWLLRADILKRCDGLLADHGIDLKDWDSLREENRIYMELGGNGDVAARMKLVSARVEHQEVNHG